MPPGKPANAADRIDEVRLSSPHSLEPGTQLTLFCLRPLSRPCRFLETTPARRLRLMRWVFAVLLASATGLRAQEWEDWSLLPAWIRDTSIGTGVGYTDNVGLAPQDPEASAFLSAEIESFWFRLPQNHEEVSVFFTADLRYYLTADILDTEELIFGQARFETGNDDGWKGWTEASYLFQHEVLDVTVTNPDLGILPVIGNTFILGLGLEREFGSNWWMSLGIPLQRQYFQEPLDDYWAYGPEWTAGFRYGRQSDLALRYELESRPYDTFEQSTADGVPIPGTHRSFLLQQLNLEHRHYWDPKGRWRTRARLAAGYNDDGGSGYFDFRRLLASGEVRFRSEGWECLVEARIANFRYPVQTVSPTDPEKRNRTDLELRAACRIPLSRLIGLSAEYLHERTVSNVPDDEYSVNTLKGGVVWSF